VFEKWSMANSRKEGRRVVQIGDPCWNGCLPIDEMTPALIFGKTVSAFFLMGAARISIEARPNLKKAGVAQTNYYYWLG